MVILKRIIAVVKVKEGNNEVIYYDNNNTSSAYDLDEDIVKSLNINYEEDTDLSIIHQKLKTIMY